LDWRNHEGNSVTPVKDQANCGACWAFAMTGGLESNVALTQKKSVSLSEQAFLDCSGVGSCDGASSLNADYLVSIGLPLESRFPYEGKDLTGFKKFNYCEGPESFFWKRHTYKIGRWGSITHDLTSIKAALASFGPIPTAMFVYEDFMNYKSGVYSYTTGEELGGHAVLLVGYNDEEKYFIVKNSWGTGWGESGFFRIAYSEVTSKAQFGISTIAYQAKQQITTPASLPNADVISDSVDRLQDSLMK
jgi:C1A family cysteine protease